MRVREMVLLGQEDGPTLIEQRFPQYRSWKFLAPTCTEEVVIGMDGTRAPGRPGDPAGGAGPAAVPVAARRARAQARQGRRADQFDRAAGHLPAVAASADDLADLIESPPAAHRPASRAGQSRGRPADERCQAPGDALLSDGRPYSGAKIRRSWRDRVPLLYTIGQYTVGARRTAGPAADRRRRGAHARYRRGGAGRQPSLRGGRVPHGLGRAPAHRVLGQVGLLQRHRACAAGR